MDGSVYVGEFTDGQQNFQGTWTFPDGDKYVGEWKMGGKWNGTFYERDGTILYKIVKGKWIKQ